MTINKMVNYAFLKCLMSKLLIPTSLPLNLKEQLFLLHPSYRNDHLDIVTKVKKYLSNLNIFNKNTVEVITIYVKLFELYVSLQ